MGEINLIEDLSFQMSVFKLSNSNHHYFPNYKISTHQSLLLYLLSRIIYMSDSKKEITIYDIAKQIGISTATVSRSLSGHSSISEKTKILVHSVAKELGYRQNSFASSLRKQKSHTIGVIIHELKSSFTTSVLAGIEKVTAISGYDLIIAHSSESINKEIANANNLFHKRVDGIIASLSFETENLNHFEPFTDKNIPLVFFDRVEEYANTTKVIIDNYKCGYQATKHLIEQGCKEVLIVTGNQRRNVYQQRLLGYKNALFERNLPLREDLVFINDLSEDSVLEVVSKIIKMRRLPDGAFITNDYTAAVFMKKLKEFEIRIPDDIAIVGFNNDAISRIIEPELTTINYPGFMIGEVAATNLVNHLSGTSNLKDTSTIIINSELIIRHSSLKSRIIRS
ncbi:MAG: hypothetical protein RLZZ546_854 [Bacteroidota bacterium]